MAAQLRRGDPQALAEALRHTRARTLALAEAWREALGDAMQVPHAPGLNPPLWELGHIGWFQDGWIARNRQRDRGVDCDPDHARAPSRLDRADDWYDSSTVAHATRWQLPLPGWHDTRAYLQAGLEDSLALLRAAEGGDLYFWQLALFHEDMHNEAWVYMAQALDIPLPAAVAEPGAGEDTLCGAEIEVPACTWRLGSEAGAGFAFDNEQDAHDVALPAFRIDAAPVTWSGWIAFLQATGHPPPPFVRQSGGSWEERRFGRWQPLDLCAAVRHVNLKDAQAWCAWSGRRLPNEAEWECAAMTQPGFRWGEVWEWTATPFEPYPGFREHPYVDYSRPWFGSRQVLRGACTATAAGMRHPRYRNFFQPDRTDIYAGFRTCAM